MTLVSDGTFRNLEVLKASEFIHLGCGHLTYSCTTGKIFLFLNAGLNFQSSLKETALMSLFEYQLLLACTPHNGPNITLIAISDLYLQCKCWFFWQYRVAHQLFKRSHIIQEKLFLLLKILWFYPIVWRYVHNSKTMSF